MDWLFSHGAVVAHCVLFLASGWMWLVQVHAMKSAWAQRVGHILSMRASNVSAEGRDRAKKAYNAYEPVVAATELGWWSSIACCLGTFAMVICAWVQAQDASAGAAASVGDIYSSAVVAAFAGAIGWSYALHRRAAADRAYVVMLSRIVAA